MWDPPDHWALRSALPKLALWISSGASVFGFSAILFSFSCLYPQSHSSAAASRSRTYIFLASSSFAEFISGASSQLQRSRFSAPISTNYFLAVEPSRFPASLNELWTGDLRP